MRSERKSARELFEELNDTDESEALEAICMLMIEDAKISTGKLAIKLGISASTVEKHLAVLKSKGVIVREGGTRGYWRVIIK